MKLVSDIKLDDTANFILMIGRSGSGKTGAAASFPLPEDVDFDDRIEGLVPMSKIIGHPVRFEQFRPPQGWLQIDDYLDKKVMDMLSKSKDLPKTIIWDSFGGFARLMLSESLNYQKGRVIGGPQARPDTGDKAKGLRVEGPADYKYEASATRQVLDRLRNFKGYGINVIGTAHIIDKWGVLDESDPLVKAAQGDNPTTITEQTVIGERLNLTNNLAETILTYFNEIYRFEKVSKPGGDAKYIVKFNTDMARSAILGNLKGEFDITNKNFYEFWLSKVKERIT